MTTRVADAAEAAPSAIVSTRLVDDYPAPLTAAQRLSLQRYVSRQIHKYTVVHRTTRVVQRGLRSLQQLIDRLDAEAAVLQRRIDAVTDATACDGSSSSSSSSQQPTAAAATTAGAVAATDAATATTTAATNTSTSATPAAAAAGASGRRGRGVGAMLRRGAVLASMQSVLQTARKEADDTIAQLSRTRERIALQTRLSLVHEDVARQRALLTPLHDKLTRCRALDDEAAREVHALLTLHDEMLHMEADYPACFVLKAVGAVVAAPVAPPPSFSSPSSTAGAAPATCSDGDAAAAAALAEHGDEHACTHAVAAGVRHYVIPCQPAQYTAECEDIVRGQIEEQLDGYLAYRARIDAVLQRVASEAQAHERSRVDALLTVIGMDASGGKDVLVGGGAEAMTAQTHVGDDHEMRAAPPSLAQQQHDVGSTSGATAAKGRQSELGVISDVDSDTDSDEDNATTTTTTTHKRQRSSSDAAEHGDDRAHIQSALQALDDFEELY